MPHRFCYICGKITADLVEGKCRDCFLKEKEILSIPKKIDAKICRDCLRFFKKGNWVYLGNKLDLVLEEVSVESLKSAISIECIESPETKITIGKIKESSRNTYSVPCRLETNGKILGKEYRESKDVDVKITLDLCQECSRKRGKYYEAVLQIRGRPPTGVFDEIISMVESQAKKDRRAFITEIRELKEGKDFYFGSLKTAKKIARSLKKKYGGDISESPKLFGVDKHGETLYRITIALRF